MKNTLKVQRAKNDLTQEELANKIGVSRHAIIAIENQKYSPSLELAFKIAKFFEIKMEELFIYEGE
ncbi:helix-turn-helix transcriptional regulator [Methanolobus sp. ZRKC2]|uniref:helix-turn-helix transcriptional regulator n=1 Tax=Methanolobus sp. ZRKC2 TaxID=3125783 RepID=UPI0038739C55